MVALITGASSGIGFSLAKEFAKKGYDLVLHYNKSIKEIEQLQKEIKETYQRKVFLIKADLSKKEEVEQMLFLIKEKKIKIDVLVNNAAIAIDTLVEDKTWENFEDTMRVNAIAPFFIAREIGEEMKKEKKGCIINVSSTNGIDTYYPMSSDYDASKAALVSLTHNLAVYFSPYIRVNAVAPGWVRTRMNENLEEDFIHKEEEKILMHRFADPEEIAKVIVFLASDDASYINNEMIRVDGGFYA